MKKFLLLCFLILNAPSVFASAAEDLTLSVYDKAMRERNGISISNVASNDGRVTYDAKQSFIVGGSKHTISQKNIPLNAANDAFYKNTAKHAKNLLKGGAVGLVAAAAMQSLLDGVGYMMGEGSQIQLKPDPDEEIPEHSSKLYKIELTSVPSLQWVSSAVSACNAYINARNAVGDQFTFSHISSSPLRCYFNRPASAGGQGWQTISTKNNPDYNPSYKPEPKVPTDENINDAFSNWFKNNPGSVTDPVTTYIHQPKTPDGYPTNASDPNYPSFGGRDITDEMMENYVDNYKIQLANDQYWADKIQSGNKTETSSNPSGQTNTIVSNPDGSTTSTSTSTHVNPETGEVTTTKTETTTYPDNTTSTKTETTHQTKPNSEISEIPLACDYLAFLCDFTDWFKDWTKQDPEIPEELPGEIIELDIGQLDTGTFSATAGCPAPLSAPVNILGTSDNLEISYEPICALAEKWSFVAPLIGFISGAMILIGVGRKGEDGDS